MGLDFILSNGGRRLAVDITLPIPQNYSSDPNDETQEEINLGLELPETKWRTVPISEIKTWRPSEWDESPIRFVDGKDVGQTVAWINSPDGYPVPIRLAQNGSIVMILKNGEIRRDYSTMDKVISMVVDPFHWDEIDGFASSLQKNGIRPCFSAQ